MDFQQIVSISQGPLSIMNPLSIEKVLYAGEIAGMAEGKTLIDFGCGNGTVLGLWSQNFGIGGVGIDIREDACRTASMTLEELGVADKVSVFFANAAEYEKDDSETYDFAVALGASQIWGGIEETLKALSGYLSNGGSIIIGDRYWKKDLVPPEFCRQWSEILTEYEIMQIIRDNGYELRSVIRASDDDWDIYESGIWRNCQDWLAAQEDKESDDYKEVLEYLSRIQEEYIAYGREYIGWAMYIITPAL